MGMINIKMLDIMDAMWDFIPIIEGKYKEHSFIGKTHPLN